MPPLRDVSAVPSRRRAEGSPLEGGLPSQATEDALLIGMRRPLGNGLVRLEQYASRIEQAWRKLLRRVNPSRTGYDTLAGMDLAGSYRHLAIVEQAGKASGDEAYHLGIEQSARTLIASGVPEEHAMAAVALYLESCLGYLTRPDEARALVRLTSATQGRVAACYCEERVAGLRRLDDRERQKLSADLHDEVGADLIVLKLYIEMVAMELSKGSVVPVAPKLQEALVLVAHAIDSVRRLTLDLGPAFLDSVGFLPAVRSFIRQFSIRTGIQVGLEEKDAPVSMPASHETALYRVLRGALSNVAKHSMARRVTVTLRRDGGDFLMAVADDGKGFDVRAQSPDRSFGLTAMRERIRGLQGRVAIESRRAARRGEASGTRIEVRLPLRKSMAS